MTPVTGCRRVFDLAEAGFNAWPDVWVGIGLVVIGVAIAWFMPNASAARRWGVLVFALVWASASGLTTVVPYLSLKRSLLNGGGDVIEGRITEYRALGERQTGDEYFVVGGRRFAFSEFDSGPGFKLTRRRGGTLDTGTYVRIKYRDDVILQLDVCDFK
jgi:hypothetical protein